MPPSRTPLIFPELPPQPVVRRDDDRAVRRPRGSARNRRPRGVPGRRSPVPIVAAQRRSRRGRARDSRATATTTAAADRGIILRG